MSTLFNRSQRTVSKNQPTVVYQIGYAIFGAGDTYNEAITNAIEWIEDAKSAQDVEKICLNPESDGDMAIANATPALVKYVQENGTCDFDEMEDGIICLPEENA